MDEKKQTQSQNNKPATSSTQKSSNKALFWILGGCLALLLIGGLVVGGLAYWSYKKVKKEIKERKPKIEQWESNLEKMKEQTKPADEEIPAVSEEGTADEDSSTLYPPAVTEKAMGFVKKVYTKNGKNYLDVDYVQWFMGAEAEKAMREDGECPKAGECIVLDDYYIRNQNPQLRTFEIAPDVEITMQTYDMETTGQIQAQKISFIQFSQIWSANAKPYLKNVPYHIGIGNNKILSISEQYVP